MTNVVFLATALLLQLAVGSLAAGHGIVEGSKESGAGRNYVRVSQRSVKGNPAKNQQDYRQHRQLKDTCDRIFAAVCMPYPSCISCFNTLDGMGIDWASMGHTSTGKDVAKYVMDSDAHPPYCGEFVEDPDGHDAFAETIDACSLTHHQDGGHSGNKVYDQYHDHNRGHGEEKKKQRTKQKHKEEQHKHQDQNGGDEPDWSESFATTSSYEYHHAFDCSRLTECDWDGIDRSLLGDGVCNSHMEGCYNSAVCGFDGGDCCEDTCKTVNRLKPCGTHGFRCHDPASAGCDSDRFSSCGGNSGNGHSDKHHNDHFNHDQTGRGDHKKHHDEQEKDRKDTCPSDLFGAKISLSDFSGNGWDNTELSMYQLSEDGILDGLVASVVDGSRKAKHVCLSHNPSCYSVNVTGGSWGENIQWQIEAHQRGVPILARGAGPGNCTFPVGGSHCPNTCTSIVYEHPSDDPQYSSLEDLSGCIEAKCPMQQQFCQDDPSCNFCLDENIPSDCFSNTAFRALVSCTMCNCRQNKHPDSTVVDEKSEGRCGGLAEPAITEMDVTFQVPNVTVTVSEPEETYGPKTCTPDEIAQGFRVIANYSDYVPFKKFDTLVSDYDPSDLDFMDTFIHCGRSYSNDPMHGGRTAASCVVQFFESLAYPAYNEHFRSVHHLLFTFHQSPQNFCSASQYALASVPSCDSFATFHTVMDKVLHACFTYEGLQCDYMQEFAKPCESNLVRKFGSVDWSDSNQCSFVNHRCGGLNLPAFDMVGCAGQWTPWQTFYTDFTTNCEVSLDEWYSNIDCDECFEDDMANVGGAKASGEGEQETSGYDLGYASNDEDSGDEEQDDYDDEEESEEDSEEDAYYTEEFDEPGWNDEDFEEKEGEAFLPNELEYAPDDDSDDDYGLEPALVSNEDDTSETQQVIGWQNTATSNRLNDDAEVFTAESDNEPNGIPLNIPWLLAFVGIGGLAVYAYKKRWGPDWDDRGFTFSSLRQTAPRIGDDTAMYSQVSSTEVSRFEPPSISVTPVVPISGAATAP